jgi:glutaredoxin
VVVYLFWVDGCPHCVDAKAFLETLEERYPQIEVKKYEMTADEGNEKLLQDILSLYGVRRQTYPTIFIGDLDPVMGYHTDSTTGTEIEEKLQYCLKNRCGNRSGGIWRRGSVIASWLLDLCAMEFMENPDLSNLSGAKHTFVGSNH